MIYIVTAVKPEAQAFVDKFKLSKTKYENFTIYSAEEITVIISGVGSSNSKTATRTIIENFRPKRDDIFLNVGICGANTKYKIGDLIVVGSIIYKNHSYLFDKNTTKSITCVDEEINSDIYDIVDMESFGFYEATKDIKNRHIYKIVSDHFEPERVTKDKTKSLVFNAIEEIMKRVKNARYS